MKVHAVKKGTAKNLVKGRLIKKRVPRKARGSRYV